MSVLRQTIVCPACHGTLLELEDLLRCERCGGAYEVAAGVPDLRPPRDGTPSLADEQAVYYDHEADVEWEIERPLSAARLYRWLMAEKFRRSISAIEHLLPDSTVLTVCGGSGMDAEFLALCRASVIASDVSQEAVRRALVRSQRHAVAFDAITADIYDLPFEDHSIDIVYVHDGLHHLEQPLEGLREMARVARVAVSVTEPVAATATRLAMRMRIAQETEDAGNRVERLDPADVASVLAAAGFQVVASNRYGMFYRHEPGWAMRIFSKPGLYEVARIAFKIANAIASRIGNKLAVQAVRAR